MNEPRFPLIRSWLDKLKPVPKPVIPIKRTLTDRIAGWFADTSWSLLKGFLVRCLKIAQWLLERK